MSKLLNDYSHHDAHDDTAHVNANVPRYVSDHGSDDELGYDDLHDDDDTDRERVCDDDHNDRCDDDHDAYDDNCSDACSDDGCGSRCYDKHDFQSDDGSQWEDGNDDIPHDDNHAFHGHSHHAHGHNPQAQPLQRDWVKLKGVLLFLCERERPSKHAGNRKLSEIKPKI